MRLIRLPVLLIAICTLLQSTTGYGQDKPILMLETGGHQAIIKSLAFTPDGKYLISAGDDKVIRIWDWQAQKTVRTIRSEVGVGDEGKIYSLALSTDGRYLAVGGYIEGDVIRLYDVANGTLEALLKGHDDVVHSLAFSLDGKHLISGSADQTAIIWDVASARRLRTLKGHRAQIYGVGFTIDGERAITGSFDQTLRLWKVADGAMMAEMTGHGEKVFSLSVSTQDGTIASGDYGGEIRLWDGKTGKLIRSLVKQVGAVGSLHYSPDGRFLISTCGQFCRGNFEQRIFEVASAKQVASHKRHDNIVIASAFSVDGNLVATAGGDDRAIYIWDPKTGETKHLLKGTGQTVWAVAFSPDSREIAWGQTVRYVGTNNFGPLEMQLRLPQAGQAVGEPAPLARQDGWVRGQEKLGNLLLQDKPGGSYGYNAVLEIIQDGVVRKRIVRGVADGLRHHAYTFTPDGKTVISTGSGFVTAYDLDGNKTGEFVGHESDVYSLAVSPDSKYLVTSAADQTLRLWDLNTGDLLFTLFYGTDGEWVMWTPEGFFTRSQKGGDRAGWQINRGADKAADYVTGDQVRDAFFRPDLVAEKINGDPEGKVRDAARELNIEDLLKSGIAPDVTIIKTEVQDATVTVTARIIDKGGGIGRITWRINGQEVKPDSGAVTVNRQGEITASFELAFTENNLEITAQNKSERVASKPASVPVKADEKAIAGVPHLYILAVAVNAYNDQKYRLNFAVTDALVLSRAIASAGKDYYRLDPNEIEKPQKQIVILRDDEVTAERLSATFEDLGRRIKATDVFMFFIAGHGMTIKGDYYFLPADIEGFTDEAILRQGFGPSQWREWFSKVRAQKSIWIFDTCDSGSLTQVFAGLNTPTRARGDVAFETAQQRLKESTGRTLFTAASDQQSAMEGFRSHGLLTYTILEGLAKAGDEKKGMVSLTDLKAYVEDMVPQYSRDMKACRVERKQEYCQKPKVLLGEHNFAIVPRFPQVLAMLETPNEVRVSKIATHVVIAAADLMETATRGPGAKSQLLPGTQVTVVKIEEDWAYVAVDGKVIGYVLKTQLLELRRP